MPPHNSAACRNKAAYFKKGAVMAYSSIATSFVSMKKIQKNFRLEIEVGMDDQKKNKTNKK